MYALKQRKNQTKLLELTTSSYRREESQPVWSKFDWLEKKLKELGPARPTHCLTSLAEHKPRVTRVSRRNWRRLGSEWVQYGFGDSSCLDLATAHCRGCTSLRLRTSLIITSARLEIYFCTPFVAQGGAFPISMSYVSKVCNMKVPFQAWFVELVSLQTSI